MHLRKHTMKSPLQNCHLRISDIRDGIMTAFRNRGSSREAAARLAKRVIL